MGFLKKRTRRIVWVLGALIAPTILYAGPKKPPEAAEAKGAEVILMSDSPWVGMEPEFKGKFKTGIQRLFTGESPFGVYDPKIEEAKTRLIEEIRRLDRSSRRRTNWVARITNIEPFSNKYSAPEKGETIIDYKVSFELPDRSTFWMVVSADPATVEAQTMPVSFEEMHGKFQKVLDTYLYGAGSRVGLAPRVSLASNHFHIGTATAFYKNEVVPVTVRTAEGKSRVVNVNRPIEEHASVFRDYAVSLFNNPALAYFADDGYIFTNAPHPSWNALLQRRLEAVIATWDRKPTGVLDLAREIQRAYVSTSPISALKHHPEKYVFYNMTRTAGASAGYENVRPDELKIPRAFDSMEELEAFQKASGLEAFYAQTTEMRGIGGQASLKDYMDIMQLYVDRLDYVRKLAETKAPRIAMLDLGPPFSAEHGADQLMYFVRETYEGLGRSKAQVNAAWKRYSKLIRQKSIRKKAGKIKPYETSLEDLFWRAYRVPGTNYYRKACSWLFQSSMNWMPDSK